MRYYSIELSGGKTYTSYVNGSTDPGALNVELDISVIDAATPLQNSTVHIWGIGLQDIAQASDLNNQTVTIRGGFQKGLPLANPAQAGILAQGYVFQAFGNWIGTDQTLNLVINPGQGPKGKIPNLVHHQPAGMPMATAISNALNTAFPGVPVAMSISPNLVFAHDEVGFYGTLTQYATYLQSASIASIGGTYPGVSVILANNALTVSDQTQPASGSPLQIQFTDLIGQPTWIGAPTIQFKCAMRADLAVGKDITLPQTVITNTQQAQSSLVNQKLNFAGTFNITSLRHVGNFRQPDAASWVTIVDAAPKGVRAPTA